MKILWLYNAAAGRGRAERDVEAITAVFARYGHETTPCPIEFDRNPFDGFEAVDAVVVAGGDGTVNYVVNRMKDKGLDIALGIIPAGTANDFAGAVGMSSSTVEAAEQIADGREQRLDCGWVNGLRYVNIFSFGLFTTTSQRTPDAIKHKIGKLAYIIEGIKELGAVRGLPLHVVTDGGEFDIDALMVLIFNGETAGRFRLAREASVRDGLFDAMILEKRNILRSCFDMVRVLCGGKPSTLHTFRSRNIRITSSATDILTDVDGQRGAEFPLDIRCLAGDLRVICPSSKASLSSNSKNF